MDAEQMAARIADCLEEHLHEIPQGGGLQWEPYGYPSGEHKGVSLDRATATVYLLGADGDRFEVRVSEDNNQ